MTTLPLPPMVRRSRRALAVAALVAALIAAHLMPAEVARVAPAIAPTALA